ncbi:hypothetical protein [Extibacter muris]|uniref:hypothetical protein n=1 Tax=Extibacter muris TaxID=1796622 RepID=UPI00142E0355|nr:hypothetical protein [Extibacter muris]
MAKALDVSTSELLNGERKEGAQPEHTEAMVAEALQHSNRSTKLKFEKFRQVSLIALSATLLFSWVMLLPAPA